MACKRKTTSEIEEFLKNTNPIEWRKYYKNRKYTPEGKMKGLSIADQEGSKTRFTTRALVSTVVCLVGAAALALVVGIFAPNITARQYNKKMTNTKIESNTKRENTRKLVLNDSFVEKRSNSLEEEAPNSYELDLDNDELSVSSENSAPNSCELDLDNDELSVSSENSAPNSYESDVEIDDFGIRDRLEEISLTAQQTPQAEVELHGDPHRASNVTAEQIEAYLAQQAAHLFEGGHLSGTGKYFVEMEKLYGTNAIFGLAVAAHESGWGSSDAAQGDLNNLFGIMRKNRKELTGFTSWEDSINGRWGFGQLIAGGLYRGNGRYTVESIGEKYAPVCAPDDINSYWIPNVKAIMADFHKYIELNYMRSNNILIAQREIN